METKEWDLLTGPEDGVFLHWGGGRGRGRKGGAEVITVLTLDTLDGQCNGETQLTISYQISFFYKFNNFYWYSSCFCWCMHRNSNFQIARKISPCSKSSAEMICYYLRTIWRQSPWELFWDSCSRSRVSGEREETRSRIEPSGCESGI